MTFCEGAVLETGAADGTVAGGASGSAAGIAAVAATGATASAALNTGDIQMPQAKNTGNSGRQRRL